jgi:hypothetical protein
VFVSTGDLPGPYQSLGVVQATRRGVLLFGAVDPAGTDLQADLDEQLLPQVRMMGGDGVINVRFQPVAPRCVARRCPAVRLKLKKAVAST